ncbi:hypothetical protein [Flavobacterium sp. 123]|jgi:hypothetical protein|uniref:hypothetical protein n=1 Tax=Flavobacterium sp. 123 TaxID=2135627 RepID=UPI000EB30FEE|nr:hypothetical protein [Flavobacterium sp. 123]RKS99005.1 hypothetical protein C8C88_0769 [Flavobacterium sp. 123]
MEPNKFDNQFKEKLSTREIKPSDAAWDRLDAMLSVSEKPKRKFSWLYIAASVLVFFTVGTVFFNQKESVVLNPKDTIKIQNEITIKSNETAPILNSSKKSAVVISETKKSISKSNIIPSTNKQLKNNNQIVAVSIINQKTEQKSIVNPTNVLLVENQLVIVENLKKENSSDQKSKIHVNPDNLLSQVDGELELSFREKVINKVNKNYQTLKVALDNRNNQP